MKPAVAGRLGMLAVCVLGIHLAALQAWSVRGSRTGAPDSPAWSVRLVAPEWPSARTPAAKAMGLAESTQAPPSLIPPQAEADPAPSHRRPRSGRTATVNLLSEQRPSLRAPVPPTAAAEIEDVTAVRPGVTPQPGPALSSVPRTVTVPPPARWHYDVIGSQRGVAVQGEARLHWQHDGHDYEARMEWGGTGLSPRVERSSGRLGAEGLLPRRYAQRQRGELATHFDSDAGRIVFSGNQPTQPLQPGQQDRLSLLLQVAALVHADPGRYLAGTRLSIPTATARGAEPWQLEVAGEEDLMVAGSLVRALKLERRPVAAHDQRVEIWMAPQHGHVPVRLRVTQAGGDWLEQRWRSPDGR